MSLFVFREYLGSYERVGTLSGEPGQVRFAYDPAYLNSPTRKAISIQLPLGADEFGPRETSAFFDGLVPEGSLRQDVADVARSDKRDYLAILDQVRNEPIGALLFSEEPDVSELKASYEPLSFEQAAALADAPAKVALDLSLKSRISLAGAQSKVGLYHAKGAGPADGWLLPRGGAPSTHILKACSDAFPGETLCEALLVRTVALMGLPAEECFLIPVDGHNPILAVRRYDRAFTGESARVINGNRVPLRLHQEDMCQACGLSSGLKYEPTGANYLSEMAQVINQYSTEPFEDRTVLAYYQLFDFLVGNCDNHLKNWSLLYDEAWENIRLAPLYDVVNTTRYERLKREMGVSFGGSRVIDDVMPEMIRGRLESIGIPGVIANGMFDDFAKELLPALEDAANGLSSEGFPEALELFEELLPEIETRLSLLSLLR